MLKRTKGRLLLALLVITGLAGTIHDSTLTQKERKTAITLLKNSRAEILKSVEGLDTKQLRYKASPDQLSIEDYIFFTVQSEMKYHEEMKNSMKKPCNPEKRSSVKYTDDQARTLGSDDLQVNHISSVSATPVPFRRTVDALVKFQSLRQEHIRYMRTSTEDMRNHVVNTQKGWMDSYQYMLTLAAQTNSIAGQINQIRSSPGFPVKY